MFNVTHFELYAHYGNYSLALAEKNAYQNTPKFMLGITDEISGVSTDLFSSLSAISQDDLKEVFGVAGIGFQIIFNNTENYTTPNKNVFVINRPVPVLDRFGNVRESNISVAVWMEK